MPPTSNSTLRLVLEARALGLPMVLTLNMSDMALREGIVIDRGLLSRELGMPVLETVGRPARWCRTNCWRFWTRPIRPAGTRGLAAASTPPPWHASDVAQVIDHAAGGSPYSGIGPERAAGQPAHR
jgi:hypothetical protein